MYLKRLTKTKKISKILVLLFSQRPYGVSPRKIKGDLKWDHITYTAGAVESTIRRDSNSMYTRWLKRAFMTAFRLSGSPSQADLDRTYLMKNSFSARETSTYFSQYHQLWGERGTCYCNHWMWSYRTGSLCYWEGTYQDRNFQTIARSPCSSEGPVTSLAKDVCVVWVRRKIMDMCVENLWIIRWTVTSLSHQVGKEHLW